MSEETKLILKEIAGLRGEMQEMKTELRGEMQEMKTELRGEMREMEGRLRGEMQEMKTELRGEMQEMADGVEGRLSQKIQDLRLIMENEIIPSIHILAENHVDLNRKLNEALRATERNEWYQLHILHLESDIRNVRELLQKA